MSPSDVTVVITTRNRRAMLEQAVASVLKQMPTAPRLVVVNDASSDDTDDWLSSRGGTFQSVCLPTRHGLPGARNAGLDHVETDYVLFLDDDDLLAPDAMRRLSYELDRHPRAVASVGSRVVFDASGSRRVHRVVGRPTVRMIHREVVGGWVAISGQTMFRTSALIRSGRWDASYGSVAEDQELWLRISELGPVALVPHPVLLNRTHPGQHRPPDVRQVEARMRRRHVDGHVGPLAAEERKLVRDRERMLEAIDLYQEGSPGRAFRITASTLVASPWPLVSPLVARSSWSFLMRSAVASVAGPTASRALRSASEGLRVALRRDPGASRG